MWWTSKKKTSRDLNDLLSAEETGSLESEAAYEIRWGKSVAKIEARTSEGETLTRIIGAFDNVKNLAPPKMSKVGRPVAQSIFRMHGIEYSNNNDPAPFAEAAGLCEVVNIHYDFTTSNPMNPTTFIHLAFPNSAAAPPLRDNRGAIVRTETPSSRA